MFAGVWSVVVVAAVSSLNFRYAPAGRDGHGAL